MCKGAVVVDTVVVVVTVATFYTPKNVARQCKVRVYPCGNDVWITGKHFKIKFNEMEENVKQSAKNGFTTANTHSSTSLNKL